MGILFCRNPFKNVFTTSTIYVKVYSVFKAHRTSKGTRKAQGYTTLRRNEKRLQTTRRKDRSEARQWKKKRDEARKRQIKKQKCKESLRSDNRIVMMSYSRH
jgi:hypothetical protein